MHECEILFFLFWIQGIGGRAALKKKRPQKVLYKLVNFIPNFINDQIIHPKSYLQYSMCITIATTNHPEYPFILLSNRDEFFRRPTKPAEFRQISNNTKVLAPLDLARPEHGTWIGVTTSGKIAVLVNYRDMDTESMYYTMIHL